MKNRDQESRKERRLENLGSNHPVCVICGENDWRCLERHHIAGKAHGEDLATVCRNCHRKLCDDQKDHPQCGGTPAQVESIGYLLLGLAELFALLVITLRKCGGHLIKTRKGDSKQA